MNELQSFNFNGVHGVRVVPTDGEPMFVARDICDILELGDTSKAVERLSPSMKGTNTVRTPGGNQEMLTITEAGVYKLVFTSRKPEAERFTDWLASEVLPAIRKHGMYATPQTIEAMLNDPDTMIKTLQVLKEERQKRLLLEAKVEQDKPLVAFAETCATSEDCISVRELAKIASKQGLHIGQNRLYVKLREWKHIIPDSTEPYQEYIDRGYYEVVQGTRDTANGVKLYKVTRVTPKGQIYIIDRLRKEVA
jgi:anti-repressor protein